MNGIKLRWINGIVLGKWFKRYDRSVTCEEKLENLVNLPMKNNYGLDLNWLIKTRKDNLRSNNKWNNNKLIENWLPLQWIFPHIVDHKQKMLLLL